MIDRAVLLELRRKRPFEPFRVHVEDGRTFDIADYRKFVVSDTKLFVFPSDKKFFTMIPLREIQSIETSIAA